MAAHVRTCPTCAASWAQVFARFCGRCGAALPSSEARPWARPARWVVRGAAAVGVLAVSLLAAGVATVDLGRGAEPGARVDVGTPGLEPAGTPLSDEEAADLLARADPDRLRCEPRPDCELWRVTVDGHRPGSGVVAFDDVVLALAPPPDGATAEDGLAGEGVADVSDGSDGPGGPDDGDSEVLMAVEVASGQHRWQGRVADALGEGASTTPARLVPSSSHALLVSSDTVAAIDRDGEVVWRWRTSAAAPGREVWDTTVMSDVVLVHGSGPGTLGAHDSVTALEEATGDELWSTVVHEVMYIGDDLLIAADSGQRLRSLDPATGALRWTTSRAIGGAVHLAGPWLAAETARNATHLLDPSTGEEVKRVSDTLISDLVPAGDGWIGITADTRAWVVMPKSSGEVGVLDLVKVNADGSVTWTAHLGTHDPWVDCCEIRVEDDSIGVEGGEQRWEFDLSTGDLVSTEESAGPGSSAVGRSLRPTPDREVRWHRDGQGVDVRDEEGAARIRGGPDITIESLDPVIVRDGHGFLAVEPSPER